MDYIQGSLDASFASDRISTQINVSKGYALRLRNEKSRGRSGVRGTWIRGLRPHPSVCLPPTRSRRSGLSPRGQCHGCPAARSSRPTGTITQVEWELGGNWAGGRTPRGQTGSSMSHLSREPGALIEVPGHVTTTSMSHKLNMLIISF